MSFYDEVMRELVLALGGALFLANGLALIRRRNDASRPAPHGSSTDLAQAPLARTVTYMLIGLIVAVWALASIVTYAVIAGGRVAIGPGRRRLRVARRLAAARLRARTR